MNMRVVESLACSLSQPWFGCNEIGVLFVVLHRLIFIRKYYSLIISSVFCWHLRVFYIHVKSHRMAWRSVRARTRLSVFVRSLCIYNAFCFLIVIVLSQLSAAQSIVIIQHSMTTCSPVSARYNYDYDDDDDDHTCETNCTVHCTLHSTIIRPVWPCIVYAYVECS